MAVLPFPLAYAGEEVDTVRMTFEWAALSAYKHWKKEKGEERDSRKRMGEAEDDHVHVEDLPLQPRREPAPAIALSVRTSLATAPVLALLASAAASRARASASVSSRAVSPMSPLSMPSVASRNAHTPRPRRWNGVRASPIWFAKRWSKPALAEVSAAVGQGDDVVLMMLGVELVVLVGVILASANLDTPEERVLRLLLLGIMHRTLRLYAPACALLEAACGTQGIFISTWIANVALFEFAVTDKEADAADKGETGARMEKKKEAGLDKKRWASVLAGVGGKPGIAGKSDINLLLRLDSRIPLLRDEIATKRGMVGI
ncbi:hypothetical protein C8R44DRAFT_888699 [Mycena epipterygia]|nr:hypothetical protein C8R44DRAFT_888699 [Mycena epipterygia]